MSNNFNLYNNNHNEEDNYLRVQSSQMQKNNYNLNINFSQIPEKEVNRKSTHNLNSQTNQICPLIIIEETQSPICLFQMIV